MPFIQSKFQAKCLFVTADRDKEDWGIKYVNVICGWSLMLLRSSPSSSSVRALPLRPGGRGAAGRALRLPPPLPVMVLIPSSPSVTSLATAVLTRIVASEAARGRSYDGRTDG